MVPGSVTRRFLAHVKSDFAPRLLRRRHQLPDGVKNRGYFLIMFAVPLLQLRKFGGKLAIGLEGLAQFHESTHDRDVHFHRAITT